MGASVVWWAIKCWLPYAQFGLWSLRNPGRSFKQFYAECAANSLATNKSHASLGPNLRPGRAASARRTFERLLTYGIRPDDIVVDYGCGTLRLGTLFIEYLEADRYIGLDIDQRILAAGGRTARARCPCNQALDTRGHQQGKSGARGGEEAALGLLEGGVAARAS